MSQLFYHDQQRRGLQQSGLFLLWILLLLGLSFFLVRGIVRDPMWMCLCINCLSLSLFFLRDVASTDAQIPQRIRMSKKTLPKTRYLLTIISFYLFFFFTDFVHLRQNWVYQILNVFKQDLLLTWILTEQ